MTTTTTATAEPTTAPRTPAKTTPAKAAKRAPAKVTPTTADAKAAEAKASDAKLVTHSRTAEVDRLLAAGWSKAALSREPEIAGTTVLWRLDRLTHPDVARVDALLKRLDDDKVQPPQRKSAGTASRTAGPSRAVLAERIEKATHRLDAGITEKSVARLRDAIGEALDLLRGDQPQTQTD
jgi:hypothetical protein